MPNQLGRNLLLQIPNDVAMADIGLVQQRLCGGVAPHESYSLGVGLIHGMAAFRFTRHLLYGIPVLNDLPMFIKAKEVHRYVFFTSRPDLMSMEGDQIAFRNRSYEFSVLVGIVSSHLIKVLDEIGRAHV